MSLDSTRLKRRIAAAAATLLTSALVWAASWTPLAQDGIHDPASPAIGILQEPAQALSRLPEDIAGNYVRWMRALDEGFINPRSAVSPEFKVRLRTTEVLMKNTSSMFMVRFPHRQHTAWLDCSSCHEQLFTSKAGANKQNMWLLLTGEKCGQCHGAVAFPLTECARCHNVPRGSSAEAAFGGELVREP